MQEDQPENLLLHQHYFRSLRPQCPHSKSPPPLYPQHDTHGPRTLQISSSQMVFSSTSRAVLVEFFPPFFLVQREGHLRLWIFLQVRHPYMGISVRGFCYRVLHILLALLPRISPVRNKVELGKRSLCVYVRTETFHVRVNVDAIMLVGNQRVRHHLCCISRSMRGGPLLPGRLCPRSPQEGGHGYLILKCPN